MSDHHPTERTRRWGLASLLQGVREEGTLAAWGGPIAAVIAAVHYTSRAWGPRAAAGDDVMAHLVRTRVGIGHLFLHGHLDGFLPSFAGGYQEFLFFGQGFTALLAVVRILTLGTLSDAGAMKVVTIGSFVVFPLAAAFLARSFGLTRRAAGVAAILSLLVNNPFGVGLGAIFGPALVPQQVGAILACFCIGGVLRTLAEPRARWATLTALTAAAIVVTHVITVFIVLAVLALTLPTLWLTDRPGRRALGHLAAASAAAAGLTAFWSIPFIVHRSLHGPVTTWSTPPLASRFADIMRGSYLLRPHVGVLVLVGAAFAVARTSRGRRWAAALVLAPAGFLAVTRLAIHRYPGNEIAVQLENRGIGLMTVIALFGVAALVAWATRWARSIGDVAAVGAALLVVGVTYGPWSHIAAQQPPASPGLRAAAQVIRRVVPPGARFAEVRQFPADVNAGGGVQHPDFYLAWESGRATLNEFNVESTKAVQPAFVPEHLLDNTARADAAQLAALGVTHVVSSNPVATAHLLESPRFRVIWAGDGWSVLSVAAEDGQPDPSSLLSTDRPARATLTESGPEHLRIAVDATDATDATIAVAWSPRWKIRVQGGPAEARRSTNGLIAVSLPRGASTLTVDWSGDPWAGVGLMVTALTVVTGVGALIGSRRRIF